MIMKEHTAEVMTVDEQAIRESLLPEEAVFFDSLSPDRRAVLIREVYDRCIDDDDLWAIYHNHIDTALRHAREVVEE
jgi:hypothetical protein